MGWVERAGWRAITLDQGGRGDRAWVPDGAYASPDFAAAPPPTGVKPVAIGASRRPRLPAGAGNGRRSGVRRARARVFADATIRFLAARFLRRLLNGAG
jgi:hypothetical protein